MPNRYVIKHPKGWAVQAPGDIPRRAVRGACIFNVRPQAAGAKDI